MRALSSLLLWTVLSSPVFSLTSPFRAYAIPLSFEQRSATQFQARLGSEAVLLQADRISLGPVTLRFAGASTQARLEGSGVASPSTYIARAGSRTFPQFSKVALRHLYPGIDAIVYGNQEHLEYDLIVAPGASTRVVRLSFDGARQIHLDETGDLVVEAGSGTLVQKLSRVF